MKLHASFNRTVFSQDRRVQNAFIWRYKINCPRQRLWSKSQAISIQPRLASLLFGRCTGVSWSRTLIVEHCIDWRYQNRQSYRNASASSLVNHDPGAWIAIELRDLDSDTPRATSRRSSFSSMFSTMLCILLRVHVLPSQTGVVNHAIISFGIVPVIEQCIWDLGNGGFTFVRITAWILD